MNALPLFFNEVTDTCPQDITTSSHPGTNGTEVTWSDVNLVDANISSTHSSGEFFPIGDTTVTYHIVNETVSATCSFNVLVLGKDI